ncbi:aromatic-ring-hydroxylating dioxygenase subunit beta [Ramlibacter albus]|uniref:aromatic-ring-hydroxylating dioxygenase subunit beta n=1 Tax=Ramlibacter albus TaxID=2079448 RepID=UPI001C9B397C
MESALDQARELLFAEAASLDERRWNDWLGLFTPECEYWIPAWRDELTLVTEPTREISLLYFKGRARLEERVARITAGLSAASVPLPRTTHMVTNVRIAQRDDARLEVRANWQVMACRFAQVSTLFGSYEYSIVRDTDRWRIDRKKIVLMNDVIDTVLDIYHV